MYNVVSMEVTNKSGCCVILVKYDGFDENIYEKGRGL